MFIDIYRPAVVVTRYIQRARRGMERPTSYADGVCIRLPFGRILVALREPTP